MVKLGEQAGVSRAKEYREGKIEQQVGAKPTVAAVQRRKEAIRKAREEAERKQAELTASSEKLSGKSLADYSTAYSELPGWQQPYFKTPEKVKTEQQEKITATQERVRQEIEEAKQKLSEEQKHYSDEIDRYYDVLREYKKRGVTDSRIERQRELINRTKVREAEQLEYYEEYQRALARGLSQLSLEKPYTYSSIRNYAKSYAKAESQGKGQRVSLRLEGYVPVGHTGKYVKPEELGLDPSKVGTRISTKELEAEGITMKDGKFYSVVKGGEYPTGTYISPDGSPMSMRPEEAEKMLETKGGKYYSPTGITSKSILPSNQFQQDWVSSEFQTSQVTPKFSESKTFVEKTYDWTQNKAAEAGEWVGETGRGLFRSSIEAGFMLATPGVPKEVSQKSESLTKFTGATYEEARTAEKRLFKLVGTGVAYGTGSILLGSAIGTTPEWSKSLTVGTKAVSVSLTGVRQKELNLAREEIGTKWKTKINSSNVFTGTEEEFKSYKKEIREVEELEQELKERKATAKELGVEFGTSFGTAALTAGAFYAGGRFLKGAGTRIAGGSKWLTGAGTLIERGVGFYFGTEFSKAGADIIGTAKGGYWNLAGVKTAELGGSIGGFMVGSQITKLGEGKITDIFRTKRGDKLLKLDTGKTKPFWKESEGRYVFASRYTKPKVFNPSTWKNIGLRTVTGKKFSGGQITGRVYRLTPPEVLGSIKGKKQISFWEINPRTKDIYWTTKKTTTFPFAPTKSQAQYFRKYGYQIYGLPGEKPVKWEAFGYSAVPTGWKGTKFEASEFKYPGGKMDLAAYQFYSGRGISLYFTRLGAGSYTPSLSTSFFVEGSSPTVYAGYAQKFRVSKGIKEVKGTQGTRKFKAYLFKEGYPTYGEWIQPSIKMEVESVTTFKERVPFGSPGYFKLFGRRVPIIEQTFVVEGAKSPKTSFVDISGGKGVTSLPSPTRLTIYPYSGLSSFGGTNFYSLPSATFKSSLITSPTISSYTPSSYTPSSYKLSSYKPKLYKPSSYKLSSYFPTSYSRTSYQPTSYKPSSYRPTSYRSPPYRPTSYRSPPTKPVTEFPFTTKFKGGSMRRLPKRKRTSTSVFRTPSLVALGLNIRSPSIKSRKAESTGLVIRPIIEKKGKKKKKKGEWLV